MNNRVASLVFAGFALLAAAGLAARDLDLRDPAQQLDAYVRANGDTSGRPSATWATGTVYAYIPGEKPRALFGLKVFGMGRYQRIDGGFQRLSREVGYYTDLKTDAVLERWFNPWLEREVTVVPIQNDPVNRRFTLANITFRIDEVGDEVAMYREVPLRYLNPLDRATYPLYSAGDSYEAMEMFNTFVRRRDLANSRLTSVASTGSWTRLGPWLPWMEMGAQQGYLIYHSRSFKPAQGLEGIPVWLIEHVRKNHPKYLDAPTAFTAPDETSWTFFKKKIDAERKAAEAGR